MTSTDYLSRKTEEIYKVPVNVFIPSFALVSVDKEQNINFSPADLVNWSWKGSDQDQSFVTIYCEDLVDSWTDFPEELRESIKDEFIVHDYPKVQLMCPNITSFELSRFKIHDDDSHKLRLQIRLTETTV